VAGADVVMAFAMPLLGAAKPGKRLGGGPRSVAARTRTGGALCRVGHTVPTSLSGIVRASYPVAGPIRSGRGAGPAGSAIGGSQVGDGEEMQESSPGHPVACGAQTALDGACSLREMGSRGRG